MLQFNINKLSHKSITSKAIEIHIPVSEVEGRLVESVILPKSQIKIEYINGIQVLNIPKWLYDSKIRGKKLKIESRLTSL